MSSMPRAGKSIKVTVPQILARKGGDQRITVLTAYDFPTAKLLDEQPALDIILVGDSLGMVVLGYDTTIPVTMDEMVHHLKAVRRGTQRALLVADMPFMSYQVSQDDALRNAARLLQEGGANAVKLEGGRSVQPIIKRLTDSGIPVMGHVGLTPQSVNQIGLRVQGRSETDAAKVKDDALAIQEAGGFAIVLELLPTHLAERITTQLSIPTIGIGSGPHCDGQVLVINDMLAIEPNSAPFRHVKQYANIGETIRQAITSFCEEVQSEKFPTDDQSFR